MSAASDRLRVARREADFESAAEAADAMGVEVPTYTAHENGSRGFKGSASKYADFFGVNLAWLWEGRGPMKRAHKHPVIDVFERIPPERQEEALDYLRFLAERK